MLTLCFWLKRFFLKGSEVNELTVKIRPIVVKVYLCTDD